MPTFHRQPTFDSRCADATGQVMAHKLFRESLPLLIGYHCVFSGAVNSSVPSLVNNNLARVYCEKALHLATLER
jgi:hypothetical protein